MSRLRLVVLLTSLVLLLLGLTSHVDVLMVDAAQNFWTIESLKQLGFAPNSDALMHADFCGTLPLSSDDSGMARVLRKDQVDSCSELNRARLLCLAGYPAEALEVLTRGGEACPRDDLAEAVVGDSWYALGEWENAGQAWASASRVSLLVNRAATLVAAADPSRIENLFPLMSGFEESMTAVEGRRVFETLGRYARRQNDPELTVYAYSRALEFSRDRHDYYMWLGTAQRELGDLNAAYDSFLRASTLVTPRQCQAFIWIRGQLALTLEALGDLSGAQALLRETVRSTDNNPDCAPGRVEWLRIHLERMAGTCE